jgi:EmrB/QacA subfamily drug resistance transporter
MILMGLPDTAGGSMQLRGSRTRKGLGMTQSETGRVPRRGLVTVACMLAQFMAAVEGTIVAAAMPTIAGDLGGFDLFSWVFGAYMLAQAASTPIYGKLSDIYGRKRIFFAGAVLFLCSSLACGLAWGMLPLIGFRFLQGLGAGAIQPIAWTIMGDIYNPTERARMQGWLSAVWSTSAVGGPILGAFIVQHLHWSMIFWINLPIGLLTMLVLGTCLHERIERQARRVDYIGAALLMLTAGAVMTALMQAATLPASALAGILALALASGVTLAWHEGRVADPIIPFMLWRNRVLALGNAATLLIGVFIMVNSVYVPTAIQAGMGRSPTIAGISIGISSVAWTIGSILSGRIMVRTSYRVTGLIGAVIALCSTSAMTGLQLRYGPWLVMGGSFVTGFGMGFCNTTFMVSVQTAVDWSQRGMVTAANMFMRTIGQAFGAGLFGAIFNLWLSSEGPDAGDLVNRMLQPGGRQAMPADLVARLSGAIGEAMHDVYGVAAILAAIILVLAWRLPARLSPGSKPAGLATPTSAANRALNAALDSSD